MKRRLNVITLGDRFGDWEVVALGRAGQPGFERAWKTPDEEWPEGTELVKLHKHGYGGLRFLSFEQVNRLAEEARQP